MPNGQVGLTFQNSDGTRFKRFTGEQAMDPSLQLSTASSWYPQLASFQGQLVGAYVDNRSGPTQNELLFRVSVDNGGSWAAEYAPFGSATFDTAKSVPLLVTSRDGTTLYVFSGTPGTVPQYRYTQDPTLATWTGPLSAGDASMHVVTGSPCGDNSECSRAHTFEFTETATPGQWVFITGTDIDFEHWGCGRGTQAGTLGGSWSAQVGHGVTCDLSGFQGGSRATTFLDRNGNVYYLRTDSLGTNVFYQKSTDGGLTWQARVYAYSTDQPSFTIGAPVGVYVPQWSLGEYVFWAGFGGSENTVRRIPLWTAPTDYASSGTVRLFGSAGGDLPSQGDAGSCCPWTYGPFVGALSPDPVNLATGSFTAHADDLSMPGRVLPVSFTRWYNSADSTSGPLGPAWTHSFNWQISDAGNTVTVRRATGRRDTYTRNPDGTYARPPDAFDTLAKNPDGTYSFTLVNQAQYEFSTVGQLTRIHEPAGNQITLAYTAGNLTTITDTGGRQVSLSYDASNRLIQLQDPLGRKVTYAYDANSRLTTVTDKIGNAPGQNPVLHQWKYAYDGASQHITTATDPDNRLRVTNTYDGQGRVSQQRDALNALTTFAYGAGQTVLTDPRSHATTYTFDSRMRTLTQRDSVGANTYTLSYVYDAAGNRTSVTDRNGKTTDFTYDTRGNVLTKTDPQIDPQTPRYLTQFAYDSKNNLTQIIDARGFVTAMIYDPTTSILLSTSRQIDASTNAVAKYEYVDATNPGLPTTVIAPRGNTGPTPNYIYATTLSYDSQGNLTTRIDPDAAKTTFAYDAAGRLTSFVDPDGYAAGASPLDHTWTVVYDENDRETRRTDPLSQALTYGYDGTGNRTSLTDRRGNVTTYSYDANTRLASVQQKPDPTGQPSLLYTSQMTRDANGNATRITQANSAVTDYSFDELNRLSSVTTHPDAVTNLVTSYVLDGNGQPTTRTTADNVSVTYGYDALSRLTSVGAPGLATITYAYDALGHRTQMSDGTGSTSYQYDGLGRLTSVSAPDGTLTHAYDRDGNRTALGYPGNQTVSYAYSPGGRLNTVTDWASRVSTYTYQPSGLVATLQYPDAMRATYTYDRAQRLTQLVNAVGATMITSHAYTLDPEGNRTALDEFVSSITLPAQTWSAAQQVNDQVSASGDNRTGVALGADLATYAAWQDTRLGNADIFFSRRDPVSGTWSANQRVNQDAGTASQYGPPAIGVDGANNVYVLWEDRRNSNQAKPDIYFGKRPSATGTWNADRQVNDDRGGSAVHTMPRIAVRADGSAVAVWVDRRSNQFNIYAARLPAGATAWGTNARVTSNTVAAKSSPDVAIAPDGTAYAVWTDSRSGNTDVYYAKLPPGSSTWSANVKVSDDPGTAAQFTPRIGADGAGNLLVVWWDGRTNPAQIRMSRLLAGTSIWEPSRVVSDAAARPLDRNPELAVRSDGKAFAVWQDGRGAGLNEAPGYGSDYDPATVSWTVSQLVTTTQSWDTPSVAMNGTELALVWANGDSGVPTNILSRRRTTGTGVDHFAYGYDGLNRLTSVTGPVAETFTFDAATNITSRTGPSATNSYDTSNRQTSNGTSTFTWSPADRLVQRGPDTFAYDSLARLTSSTVSATTRTFVYDGDGLLKAAATTSYLWDVAMTPSRLLQAGTDKIVYGLGPLYAVRADSSTDTFALDGLGSVRAELNDSGSTTKSFRYAAYGDVAQSSPSGATPTLLGFAGEPLDPSGLLYLRARWYDPKVGRFITSDPLFGRSKIPLTLNRYSYAHANPTRFIDPSGLWCAGGLPFAFTAAMGIWFAPGGAATITGIGFGYCHDEETGANQLGWFKYGGKFSSQDDVQKTFAFPFYVGVGAGAWWSPNARSFADIAGPFVTGSMGSPFVEAQYSVGQNGIEMYSVTFGPSGLVEYTVLITRTEILGTIDLPAGSPVLKGF